MKARHLVAILGACLLVAACASSQLTTTVPATAAPGAGSSAAPAAVSAAPSTGAAKPSPSIAEAAPCVKRALKFDPKTLDLTGAWGGDDDGIYYIRQIGKVIWWSGMSGAAGPADQLGRDWNNVATGTIKYDLTIPVTWADVRAARSWAPGPWSGRSRTMATGTPACQGVRDRQRVRWQRVHPVLARLTSRRQPSAASSPSSSNVPRIISTAPTADVPTRSRRCA